MPSEPAWPRLVATSTDAWIWLTDLDEPGTTPEAAFDLLSDDERTRAGRFVFHVHRQRFVAARATLRTLLAAQLACGPRDVRFEYGPSGKPSLAGGALRFNLSHSDRLALVAVARHAELGVDIERIRPLPNMELVAERVFSAAEREALGRVGPAQQAEAFFAGWTRKEAYIKARGEGIGLLSAVEVALTPGEDPRLIRVAAQPGEIDRWSLYAFDPAPGYTAAVCIEGRDRHWSPL